MNCMSCNTEIPPNWVAALQSNVCPACGGEIMNEQSKELMEELRSAMEEMPNDPEGLAGWLLSNYQISKVGDGQPVNFYGRQPAPQHHHSSVTPGSDELPPGFKIRDAPINKFLKNAGMQRLIDNPPAGPSNMAGPRNVKDIVNHIHNSIEAEEAAIASDYYPEGLYPEDEVWDPEADFVSMGSPAGTMAEALANNSSLGADGGPPPTDAEKAALIAALSGEEPNAPMIPGQDLHPALRADRAKRNNDSANVGRGGVGAIRRRG